MNFDTAVVVAWVTALANALSAGLAWWAKLRWSKEFADAKDETIKAKEAQIAAVREQLEAVKEMASGKVREIYLNTKLALEESIAALEGQLAAAKSQLAERDARITQLTEASVAESRVLERDLKEERQRLESMMATLQQQVEDLKSRPFLEFNPDVFKTVVASSTSLANSMTHGSSHRSPAIEALMRAAGYFETTGQPRHYLRVDAGNTPLVLRSESGQIPRSETVPSTVPNAPDE